MRHLMLLALPAILWSQEYAFRALPSQGDSPAGRVDGAIAFDERGNQLIVFGGRATSTRNDLYAYNLDRGSWTELRPTGTVPPARFGHTLIYDAARRRVILFGGQASGFFSDTWAYDLDRNTWQQLASDNAGPSRRYGHSAVYDATRNRMIISHGFTDAGRFDDTWAFDLATNRWTNLSPSSERPLRRCLHHAVLDAPGNQMLLYGGCASGFGPCPLADLWSFDLNTNRWTEVASAVKPAGRQWYGMGFDAMRRRLLLFGGSGENGNLNDTWEYDPAARQWTQLNPASAPDARNRHEAAYVPGQGIVFFGGATGNGLSNELLLLSVNARSLPIAPGELISLPAPETATVTFNGIEAPLLSAQAGQFQTQVPYEISGSTEAEIVIRHNGQIVSTQRAPVVPANPRLYPNAYRAGDDILVLFATGAGNVLPAIATGIAASSESLSTIVLPVELRINGQPVELQFAGLAPGTIGIVQLNTRIPGAVPQEPFEATLRIGETQTTAMLTLR